jgi:hypothetical protein
MVVEAATADGTAAPEAAISKGRPTARASRGHPSGWWRATRLTTCVGTHCKDPLAPREETSASNGIVLGASPRGSRDA